VKIDGSKVRIALAGVIIGVLLGAYIGFSASPSSTFTISGGLYPGAPSYTIWREGNNYFAKNENGEIKYSGTNASQVINEATSNGGKIFLCEGTFLLDAPILLPSYTILEGSGFSTVLKRNADNVTIIRNKDPPSDPYGVAYTNQEIIVRDLKIDGGNESGYSADEWHDVINFVCVSRLTIENLIIENADGYNDAIDLDACANVLIKSVTFKNIGGAAVHLSGLYTGWTNRSACSYCNVIDCYAKNTGFDRCVAAFNIWSDENSIQPAVYNTFSRCTARNCYSGFGFDTYDPNCGRNKITDCLVVNVDHEGVSISKSQRVHVVRTTIMYAEQRGIYVKNASRVWIEDCFIKGASVYDGITVWASEWVNIRGCTIKNNNQNGIRLYGATGDTTTSTKIFDCYIYDDAAPHVQDEAIREYANSDYTTVMNCYCINGTAAAAILLSGANSVAHYSYNGTAGWIS